MFRGALALLLVAGVGAVACGSNGASTPSRDPVPPFRHQAFYARLSQDADAFSFAGGDWVESLGDAPFYGLAFYAHAGRADPSGPGDGAWLARADAARSRSLGVLTNADFLNGDLQDMVMSALGMLDAMDASGDRSDLATVDDFLTRFDALVGVLGFYVEDIGQRSWALGVYGPTSIAALLGLLNAQYAFYLPDSPQAQARVDWAVQMESNINDHAWTGGYYAFSSTEQRLDLYPNVAMIALESRLYELTKNDAYRQRAVLLYQAIQPLKLTTSPTRYYSQYLAASMGATTRDFSTLSSQNYLAIALMLLYEVTGSAAYVDEMDSVVDAMSSEVLGTWCLSNVHRTGSSQSPSEPTDACPAPCVQPPVCVVSSCVPDACHEGLLHHWIDGRIARPTDPTFFCSGCNLQMLYVLWYRQQRLR